MSQQELSKKAYNLAEYRQGAKPRIVGLPAEGFVRLPTVLTVVPVSRSAWWEGIREGRYPPGVKLGPRFRAWTVESIRTLIHELSDKAA